MLQKLKVTSYALIILLLLVLPSQAAAQCNTQDACRTAAQARGLDLGGNGYDFSGSYGTKGCYSYESGSYQGMAFFGTGGSAAAMGEAPAAPKYRISCADTVAAQNACAPGESNRSAALEKVRNENLMSSLRQACEAGRMYGAPVKMVCGRYGF